MKISEAIAQLQLIQDTEGDLELVTYKGLWPVTSIYIHDDANDHFAVIVSEPITKKEKDAR